jgi:hypothetical protein
MDSLLFLALDRFLRIYSGIKGDLRAAGAGESLPLSSGNIIKVPDASEPWGAFSSSCIPKMPELSDFDFILIGLETGNTVSEKIPRAVDPQ